MNVHTATIVQLGRLFSGIILHYGMIVHWKIVQRYGSTLGQLFQLDYYSFGLIVQWVECSDLRLFSLVNVVYSVSGMTVQLDDCSVQ